MNNKVMLKLSLKEPNQKIRVNKDYKVTVYQNNVCIEDFYTSIEKLKIIELMLNVNIENINTSDIYCEYLNHRETNKEQVYLIDNILRTTSFKEFFIILDALDNIENIDLIDKKSNKIILPSIIQKMLSYSTFGCYLSYGKIYKFLGKNRILDKQEMFKDSNLLPLFQYGRNTYIDYDYIKMTYVLIKSDKVLKEDDNIYEILKEIESKENNRSRKTEIKLLDANSEIENKGHLEVLSNNFDLNIYSSILDVFDNYRVNLSNTSKMLISHVPYIEKRTDKIITIPEIEYTTIDLVKSKNFRIGNIKLEVLDLDKKQIELKVLITSKMYLDNDKLSKNQIIKLDLNKKYTLKLDTDKGIETWDFTIQYANFEKEYRNIEFSNIMSKIKKTDNYRKLDTIEIYETKLSLMLFLNFINKYRDEESLKKLYEIINNQPMLYEEYITKYNLDKMKSNIKFNSFNDKKIFLEKEAFIDSLANANWLNYPRYIFSSVDYFSDDLFNNFRLDLESTIAPDSFKRYLIKLFEQAGIYNKLNDYDQEQFNNSLNLISYIYYCDIEHGDDKKYLIEKMVYNQESLDDINYSMSLIMSLVLEEPERQEYIKQLEQIYLQGLKVPLFKNKFKEIYNVKN